MGKRHPKQAKLDAWIKESSRSLTVLDRQVVAQDEGPATKAALASAAKVAKQGKALETALQGEAA